MVVRMNNREDTNMTSDIEEAPRTETEDPDQALGSHLREQIVEHHQDRGRGVQLRLWPEQVANGPDLDEEQEEEDDA
jgi:hypothetical protein